MEFHSHRSSADGSLESHPLQRGDNVVGRQPQSDDAAGSYVVIRSEAVSRRHLNVKAEYAPCSAEGV
jgi:hypothetical protein